MKPRIDNATARLVLLDLYGLSDPPRQRLDADGLERLIERIGFVQLDSINTVARAHHMILFARNETYAPDLLRRLHEERRSLFEDWTHDASLIPMAFRRYWFPRHRREERRLLERWRKWRDRPFEDQLERVLDHVREHGPVMSRDLRTEKGNGSTGWWDWHPSKTALEFLWRTGRLAVTRREGFQKVYDLGERVIPAHVDEASESEMIDWAASSAIERMGFVAPSDLAGFWDSIGIAEAKDWCAGHAGDLVEVEVEEAGSGNRRPCLMPTRMFERLGDLPEPPPRLRVLSPFDPLIRDRKRLERIFGFDYRIEVFVPEAQRRYGYYVFPLLEGTRLVGRIDMKRVEDSLAVRRLWLEPRIRLSAGRRRALDAELNRIRRLAGCEHVTFDDGAFGEIP
ncbi:MAG: YcaQ family DNA glycosylase [Geminicoccaceae bacterium]|nr:YcaQ family DNA glycosylase [Geminicoccaceae bacterium]